MLSWQEGRLNLVQPHGSVTPRFGGNVAAGVEESGRQGWRGAAHAGFGPGSPLHAVGEGAPWIANQVDLHGGTPGTYWVDFFPRCEALGEAAKGGAAAEPQAWVALQKDRLKANQATAVLDALAPFGQTDTADDPVTACDRYRRNRPDHLDYQGALPRGLPLGSGDIESAHRYRIQERLKRPGAGWSPAHLETRLALRLNRANREWEIYWRGVEKEAVGTNPVIDAAL